MLARYSTAIGAGAFVAAALIYWMQVLISSGQAPPLAHPKLALITPVLMEPTPPQPPTARPPPPEPRQSPPDLISPPIDPPTARDVIDGPVTPPGPTSPPGHPGGRSGPEDRGPWATDSDLLLVAEILPSYPYLAQQRELEGQVILEFTVTKLGEVTDIRVIESTERVFERAAVSAIAKARYRPRVIDGSPIEVRGLRKIITFTLTD